MTLGGALTVNAGTFQLSGNGTLSGATAITNAGRFEIAGSDALATSVTNTTGIVQVDAGATLTLVGVSISGGTINILGTGTSAGDVAVTSNSTLSGNATINGGQITLASDQTLTLDDVTLNNVALIDNGTLKVDVGQTLTFSGTDSTDGSGISGDLVFDNDGHIIYSSTVTNDFSMVTFEGSGTVTRDGFGGSSTQPNVTLDNQGNTFEGYGVQGNAGGVLINEALGTFDADFTNQTYTLEFGNVTNTGTIEATNGGTLEIANSIVANSGIVQAGANSEVLLSNATVSGGTISIASTGTLLATNGSAVENAIINMASAGELITGGVFTLDGDTINGGILTGDAAGASFNLDQSDTLTLNGVTVVADNGNDATLTSAGTVTLESTLTLSPPSGASNPAFTLLLDGGGNVTLDDVTIAATGAGEILENQNNNISGTGLISGSDLSLQNDSSGSITAQGGTLTILASVVNDGTMTAANGATLSLGGAVSGSGSTIIDDGGNVVVGALDSQGVTYDGIGTLTINPTGDLTGAIQNLVQGDIIDFANNTSITSTSISGSTLTVNESSGGPLTYTIGGATSGEYFAVQSDNNGGTELVLSPDSVNVSVSVIGSNNPSVQVGQTLVATGAITGDTTDVASPITYQWQISSDGLNWSPVAASTTGLANGVLSSFYQVDQSDLGDLVRVQASFTDDTGQIITATSTPTAAVAEITPILTVPFSYAVDEFQVSNRTRPVIR